MNVPTLSNPYPGTVNHATLLLPGLTNVAVDVPAQHSAQEIAVGYGIQLLWAGWLKTFCRLGFRPQGSSIKVYI